MSHPVADIENTVGDAFKVRNFQLRLQGPVGLVSETNSSAFTSCSWEYQEGKVFPYREPLSGIHLRIPAWEVLSDYPAVKVVLLGMLAIAAGGLAGDREVSGNDDVQGVVDFAFLDQDFAIGEILDGAERLEQGLFRRVAHGVALGRPEIRDGLIHRAAALVFRRAVADVAAPRQQIPPQRIPRVRPEHQALAAAVLRGGKLRLRHRQHRHLQLGRAKRGMDLQERLARPVGMQHCGQTALGGLPQEHRRLQAEPEDVCVDVPAPVIPADHVPAAFAHAVQRQHLAALC